jgi:hypothetical protein
MEPSIPPLIIRDKGALNTKDVRLSLLEPLMALTNYFKLSLSPNL